MPYTIRLFDSENILVLEKRGDVAMYPGEEFAIFEGGIETGAGGRRPTRAFIEFQESAAAWERSDASAPKVAVSDKSFSSSASNLPRLEAVITNESPESISRLTLVATVLDESGNAFAVSKTEVRDLARNGQERVTFLFPRAFSRQPIQTVVYPHYDELP